MIGNPCSGTGTCVMRPLAYSRFYFLITVRLPDSTPGLKTYLYSTNHLTLRRLNYT